MNDDTHPLHRRLRLGARPGARPHAGTPAPPPRRPRGASAAPRAGARASAALRPRHARRRRPGRAGRPVGGARRLRARPRRRRRGHLGVSRRPGRLARFGATRGDPTASPAAARRSRTTRRCDGLGDDGSGTGSGSGGDAPDPAPTPPDPARLPDMTTLGAPAATPADGSGRLRPGPGSTPPSAGRRRGPVARPAAGHLLVDRRRRDPDLAGRTDRADLARPPHRPGRLGAAARAGPADGPDARAGEGLRPGPAGRAAPARRLHVVQPDGRPRRADHLGVRRRAAAADARHALAPHRRLPRHAAGRRRHLCARHGRGHQHQGRAPPAALRVVAPAAPLRLPRRRPRPAAPAVDRPGARLLPGPRGLLVGALDRRARLGARLARRAAPVAHLRHGLRVTAVVREAPGIVSVHVAGARLHRMPVEAGQFLSWRFLGRRAGPAPTPTRSPPPPTAAACGSPSRRPATAAPTRAACGPAPGCWSRARTDGSARGPGPGARSR